jgi:hypothetical protein
MRAGRRYTHSSLAAVALAAGLAAGAAAQSRSPWLQHDGLEMTPENPLGLVPLSCTPQRNGDICEYDVATIPLADDPGWQPAPNPDVIDFSVYPSRVCEAPLECFYYADFTYFQTFVDIPADITVTRFTIAFDGMDDGSRVSLFNSAYPDGIVVPGSYVYYHETGTADLAALVRAGEVNRVVVTQVDDCCDENQLRNASVVLNGERVAIVVDSFLLPSSVKYAPNAGDPSQSTFVASGVLDTGSTPFDPTASAMLEIGSLSIPIPSLTPSGDGFIYQQGGVSLVVTPSKGGGSRMAFGLSFTGDLVAALDPGQPLRLALSNPSLDASAEMTLAGGRFKRGRVRGSLLAPRLFPEKAKARLDDAGLDSVKVTAGFATGGQTPDAPPDVHFVFGDAYDATIPASAFRRSRDRWVGRLVAGPATLSIVLDYARERIQVKARRVELGAFAEGPVPLRFELAIGAEARGAQIRAVRDGSALRY